jgi:ubiquinone/menaquinone biosynthesis C-methylase UbiE
MTPPRNNPIDAVVDYYNVYDEQGRLSNNWGQIEYFRSQSIIRRHIAPPPAVVLDVGGAAGRYACWLAREGYTAHLIDPVPLHVQQAQAASSAQPETPIASCQLGDARQLDFEDEQAHAILMMGPLYHLVQAQDRRRALCEAFRVLKADGVLLAVGISRFASTIDGLASGYWQDPAFRETMRRDLEDGQHRNPTRNPAYFTDSFFHHPSELKAEVADAGFQVRALVAVEGISYVMKDLDRNWAIESHRAFLLELLERIEQESCLIGASPHIMCVGVKPGGSCKTRLDRNKT